MSTTFSIDERDTELMYQRTAELDSVAGYRCGDYVRFPDGHLERISHVWDDGVQTSAQGSWYLGHGYVSFSGGLNEIVKNETLTLTDEVMPGSVWFFHHDYWTAHNGVTVTIAFRVYESSHPRLEGEWQ